MVKKHVTVRYITKRATPPLTEVTDALLQVAKKNKDKMGKTEWLASYKEKKKNWDFKRWQQKGKEHKSPAK